MMRRRYVAGVMTRFARLLSLFVLIGALAVAVRAPDAGTKPPVLVELFTSQGCASCPPAEAYLKELAERDDVIALEFHVDYWDYLGWKDVFAKRSFTKRQKNYVRTLPARYVYTPQIVVNGKAHAVGSKRDKVERLIREAQAEPDMGPRIQLRRDGDTLVVSLGPAQAVESYDVTFVSYDKSHVTEIQRGENRGRTVVNANVVRELEIIGDWSGQPVTFTVLLAGKKGDGGSVIIVQKPGPGPVLSAARLSYQR